MSYWTEVRREARRYRREARLIDHGASDATALLAAAARMTGITCVPVAAGDALLDGGDAQLDPDFQTIWYNQDLAPDMASFYQTHEYAHHWLEESSGARCHPDDIDPEAVEERTPYGLGRVEGYGPEQRAELAANVFAREFLAPTDTVRTLFLDEGIGAASIATRLGVVEGLIVHQLMRALLAPPDEEDDADANDVLPPLDPTQEAAAHARAGPLLIEAGPGTGKTRTLVGRLLFLVEQGVPADAILALTFANKAAEELRARVAQQAPDAAAYAWIGTFHAFGLELLRRYGTLLGLPPRPTLLDPIDALILIERELPSLRLDHYRNLAEPMPPLRAILATISRAKDELCGPDDYLNAARRMRAVATTREEVVAAEKALEVAGVYAHYQAYLDREHLIDLGDLIALPVRLLRRHPDIRAQVRATFTHILVDEYQDVNRASALLLQEIAGAGHGLWAVGDVRQAIYRFRGAAPSNMRRFAQDFPGAESAALGRNYRSARPILALLNAFAPTMRASRRQTFTPWDGRQRDDGHVVMEVASDEAAEGRGLAEAIARRQASGVPYRDQAVLCRTHLELARFAAHLERAGIPTLYLDDLFERPEVRDMLALLALACQGDGSGLVRVACFPDYQIAETDVREIMRVATQADVPFPRALSLAAGAPTLSPHARARLTLLARHLDGLCYGTTAWTMVTRYLFERGDYVRDLARRTDAADQRRRFALHQFLSVAHDYLRTRGAVEGDPKAGFLRHIRQLETMREEQQLRQVPSWAQGIDAVRLLTVHTAKGLEFPVVYLPRLGQAFFPHKRRPQECPLPPGIAETEDDAHVEEEECLFFVALSRARDVLSLSRAESYGKVNSKASTFLRQMAGSLPHAPDGPVTWVYDVSAKTETETEAQTQTQTEAQTQTGRGEQLLTDEASMLALPVSQLSAYLRCPRRYYYEFVLKLHAPRYHAAHAAFHRVVRHVVHWIHEQVVAGIPIDAASAQLRLADAWAEAKIAEHPHGPLYLEQASHMVAMSIEHVRGVQGRMVRPTWDILLPHGRVEIRPDCVDVGDGAALAVKYVYRRRSGMSTGRDDATPDAALLMRAMGDQFPTARRTLIAVNLVSGDSKDVSPSPDDQEKTLQRCDAALSGIAAGRFPPAPSDYDCPRCPFYFICPAPELGA